MSDLLTVVMYSQYGNWYFIPIPDGEAAAKRFLELHLKDPHNEHKTIITLSTKPAPGCSVGDLSRGCLVAVFNSNGHWSVTNGFHKHKLVVDHCTKRLHGKDHIRDISIQYVAYPEGAA